MHFKLFKYTSVAVMACLQQLMLVLDFLRTWYVCHNYKKRLHNRNVLLRVECLISLHLISAFFFLFFFEQELEFDNFTNFKKEQQVLQHGGEQISNFVPIIKLE